MLVTRVRVAAYCSHLMNRQQTLRKFFEMPRNVKPTPPQQSSLAEMWGAGKKKRKVDQSPPTVPASEDGVEKKVASEEARDGAVPSSPAKSQGRESLSPKRTNFYPIF
jgi:DNA ligase-1